jgi:PAS domain S-box-containing protein
MKKILILHLEDNPSDAYLIQSTLKHSDNIEIKWVDTKEQFEASLLNPLLDIVLADYTLPNYNGLDALFLVKKIRPELPFILISGTIGEERTIEIFQAGATDFVSKDNLLRIEPAILRALKEVNEKVSRKKAEEKLKEKEQLFTRFTENIDEVFWRTSRTLDKTLYVSPAFEKIWGYPVDVVYQNPLAWFESIAAGERDHIWSVFSQFIEGGETHLDVSFNIIRPDGQRRFIICKSSKSFNNDIPELIGVSTDGTERENTRLKLLASLKEKEVMLKEIYHRVKNNLQVVNSILSIQVQSIKDDDARKVFIESSTRIKAMGLVHEMLYRTGDLSHIELGKYAGELFKNLNEIYRAKDNHIEFIVNSEDVQLNLENAIPCGLILNELISNTFKYAFPNGHSGKITLIIQKHKKNIVLIYGDNGIGLPLEVDFYHTHTLGLQLINKLTKQIDGTVTLNRDKGTVFTLTFPDKS